MGNYSKAAEEKGFVYLFPDDVTYMREDVRDDRGRSLPGGDRPAAAGRTPDLISNCFPSDLVICEWRFVCSANTK